MTFGEKLKIARTDAGLKQAELAKQLHTTGNTISNWENNVSKPDLDMLAYICGVLNVKASFFLESKVPEDEISLPEFKIIRKYRFRFVESCLARQHLEIYFRAIQKESVMYAVYSQHFF